MTPVDASSGSPSVPTGVIVLTMAYLIAAIIGAIATGNGEFVFYIVVMVVLIGAILVAHRRIRLSNGVLWGLSLWGLLHMAGGLVPVPQSWPIHGDIRVLYSWWLIPERLKYDQVVHAYGFAVTTLVCWQGLKAIVCANSRLEDLRPTPGMLTLCAAGSMGFGALNEVIEFTATRIVPETNVGDYVNTGWDLVFNLLGAVGAAVGVWIYDRHFRGAERRA
ncbi:hypothetical protein Mal4_43400 [Maioricimonas rarisocia]|uniref:DUF2238 domain-containing protein n=1 Tax=Maioricimonas rarisocia TaxID=2528026 RepID=A0A517ZBV9_9PLAN|nr:DUF2238 domain-containing protein [Maioricimonas rarisocia]QDU39986.1 hypothetical protein Mal4_43400 [Maioricimonas rarisocia]